jgi:outer membrane protein assembly factor BamB
MLSNAAAATLLIALFGATPTKAELNEELLRAARAGDAKAVAAALAKGAEVNAKTPYGATALSYAADKGHTEVARVLIEHKADVDVKDTFYGFTPISWAVFNGHPAVAKLLVAAGAKGADGMLQTAASMGKADVVGAILETGKVKGAALDKALASTPADSKEVAELLKKAGAKATTASKSAASDAAALNAYAGSYRNKAGAELTLTALSNSLYASLGGQLLGVLSPADETYRTEKGDVAVSFRDNGGKITGLWLRQGRTETAFKRVEEAKLVPAKDPVGVVARSGNWPQFRGVAASGVADGQLPPTRFDAVKGENLRWKTPIPGLGHACPVVWGDRLFLATAVSGDPKAKLRPGSYGDVDSVKDSTEHTWNVLCLDKWTGKVLWERTAYKGVPKVKRHLKSTQANPTPATDGNCVVALFGSEGMYCYDFEGNLRWKSDLGVLAAGWFYDKDYEWGFGSSPIIYRGKVIVQVDTGKDSFVAAFDLRDGKQVWRTPREEIPSWGTPTVVEGAGKPELVTNATKFVRGYDPETGKELWRLSRNAEITVPTPIAGEGLVFVTSGYRPVQPIYAIKPGASGDISLKEGKTENDKIAWSTSRNGPYMPTPVLYGKHLYICSNNGVVTCYEAKTGKQVYKERLGGSATYTASPVAADGRLYFTSEENGVVVVNAGPKFEKVAVNPVGEVCMATPAISDGMIFVRGEHHLFAFARPSLVKRPTGGAEVK